MPCSVKGVSREKKGVEKTPPAPNPPSETRMNGDAKRRRGGRRLLRIKRNRGRGWQTDEKRILTPDIDGVGKEPSRRLRKL